MGDNMKTMLGIASVCALAFTGYMITKEKRNVIDILIDEIETIK